MQLTRIRPLTAVALALALAGCIPPSPEPTPVPSPAPSPVVTQPPTPVLAPAPEYDNWLDAPATPGNWFYVAEARGTMAVFGVNRTRDEVRLIIGCNLDTRRVDIALAGMALGSSELTIRTETMVRALSATMSDGQHRMMTSQLPASDPLLDAMAFSRGRFAVELEGNQTVYAPAWPEISRVVEDCRG